jgi:hypothetical protein
MVGVRGRFIQMSGWQRLLPYLYSIYIVTTFDKNEDLNPLYDVFERIQTVEIPHNGIFLDTERTVVFKLIFGSLKRG